AGRCFVGYDTLDEPQIVQEQGVLGVIREPLLHGLRVSGRRLAGQVAVQQEIETLVFGSHTAITGQTGTNPQEGLGPRGSGLGLACPSPEPLTPSPYSNPTRGSVRNNPHADAPAATRHTIAGRAFPYNRYPVPNSAA